MSKIIITTEGELTELIQTSIRSALNEQISTNLGQRNNEFLTIDEAAKLLKLPKASIYQFTSRREIPFVKRSRRIFFKKSDLETWLEGGRKQTRSELEAKAISELSNRRKK